jgi:hypothetical protein
LTQHTKKHIFVSMKKTITYIDVPSGWKYGFPKEVDLTKTTLLKKFVIDNGYPQQEADADYFYVRLFEKEVEVDVI